MSFEKTFTIAIYNDMNRKLKATQNRVNTHCIS